MKVIRGVAVLALVMSFMPTLAAQAGGAQGDQVDVKELVKQIRRNMVAVEKEIDRVEAEAAQAQGEQAKENLEKLIKSMKGRGDQITSDIDEIIKNMGC